MSLKSRVIDDMKMALRARETDRLKTIRMLLAAIKQREVDERIEISDPDVLAVIDKMIKQRRESIGQFERAGRHDLADSEKAEVAVLQEYMPQAFCYWLNLRETTLAFLNIAWFFPTAICWGVLMRMALQRAPLEAGSAVGEKSQRSKDGTIADGGIEHRP